jgi:predicted component of type VI protein secretion system
MKLPQQNNKDDAANPCAYKKKWYIQRLSDNGVVLFLKSYQHERHKNHGNQRECKGVILIWEPRIKVQ